MGGGGGGVEKESTSEKREHRSSGILCYSYLSTYLSNHVGTCSSIFRAKSIEML